MVYDHGFGDLGNALYEACTCYPPDFEKIDAILAQGINLNADSDSDPDENLLSSIILGYPQIQDMLLFCMEGGDCHECQYYEDCDLRVPDADGRYLPQIVKRFVNHGFDCSRRSGQAGGICLINLTWSSYDTYILDAAKLLLAAGADPMTAPHSDSPDTVLDWVATKMSAAYCVYDDWEQAELFTALYDILDAARKDDL